jgi:hypothetical protein
MSSTNPTHGGHDDHMPSGPPADEVIKRGYEADTYDARTVLSVPLLVILFFVLAFGTVTILFSFIAYPKSDGKAHPVAAERGKEPLNDRLKRIDRGPNNGTGQPRLEPLKLRDGESRAITRPELPVSEGNSPELHPEDLRLSKDKFPALYSEKAGEYAYDKIGAMSNDKLKELFKVQGNGTLPGRSQFAPTGANAGQGAEGSTVPLPAFPAAPPAPKGGKP